MLFGWETVMTFVLVSTVYAVAIGEPSFGVVGPFAVGLSLFAMVFAGMLPLSVLCKNMAGLLVGIELIYCPSLLCLHIKTCIL